MNIRKFKEGDEALLRDVFYSSVHRNTGKFYTESQQNAWAPGDWDDEWIRRMNKIRPYILEDQGEILGYADLQEDGYIDHFFIRGDSAGKGYDQLLMDKILSDAKERNLRELSAETFFLKNGFVILKRKSVRLRGEILQNALMKKTL